MSNPLVTGKAYSAYEAAFRSLMDLELKNTRKRLYKAALNRKFKRKWRVR